ncbi:hybrid sensor histidine kinase/response regulator transcription factor [Paenibacillus sp. GSMTC-2017]|uniref:helix-turn-helix transcriptional regulator n=1 Tax=Paenibacillus sp. GSMTC-2017 TaxID=2794350 RepID=UPI0018D9996C|nr:hybrid sensor histidine kinase/response regulator transcription factor [Paenibacillus sp. GSMTC-2017]MBH5319449.1 hybrid sensor histidine kinase/response regulator transcription factor [Paenibacillus sp. GSMTC-2017]
MVAVKCGNEVLFLMLFTKQWTWFDWTIFTLRFMWWITIVFGLVQHYDRLPYPIWAAIAISVFAFALPYWFNRYSRSAYLIAELLLNGSLYIALNYYFEETQWQFVIIAFVIGFHSIERTYRWTGPITILLIPFLAWNTARLDFDSVAFQAVLYHLGMYGFGLAFQLLSRTQKQSLIIKEQNQVLEQYVSQVEQITLLEERDKIYRELHDTIGFTMTTIIMGLETLRPHVSTTEINRLDTLLHMARGGLNETRGIVHNWAQTNQDASATVESSFHQLIEQFHQSTGAKVKLRIYGKECELSRSRKLTLYRCLQESLTNAVRHGGASFIQVGLYFEEGQIRMQVEDNGNGNKDIAFGFGLKSMRDRLEALHGQLVLHRLDDGGVAVICCLPHQTVLPQETSIRVLVVDDQPIFRESLQLILQQHKDMNVVGLAANGQEALDMIPTENPDVVLLDVRMPILDGPSTLQVIRERWPTIRIIMVTTIEEASQAANTLGSGASGYLLKSVSPIELVEAIRIVHQGETLITQSIADVLFREMKDQQKELDGLRKLQVRVCPYGLTERERGILASLVQGLRIKAIADKIFLSEGTVRNCTTMIYAKLGVNNRDDAVKKAQEEGLVV